MDEYIDNEAFIDNDDHKMEMRLSVMCKFETQVLILELSMVYVLLSNTVYF